MNREQIEPKVPEQPTQIFIGGQHLVRQPQNNEPTKWVWWKILLIVVSIIFIAATVVFATLYGLSLRVQSSTNPTERYLPKSVSTGQISPNLSSIIMNSLQLQQDQWIAIVHATNYQKTELTEPMTQSLLAQTQSWDNNLQYVQQISLERFFGMFNFSSERTDSVWRLKECFEKSPETAIKKLINEAKMKLQYPFHYDKDDNKMMDYLKIVTIYHKIQIQLFYDIDAQQFKLVPYQESSSNRWKIGLNDSQGQKSSSSSNLQSQAVPDLSDPLFENLFIRVMGNTIWEMKQLASRSISFWNSEKAQELISFQQSKASTLENVAQWKQALIKECRTIQSLKFRCNINSAHKLVGSLTPEYIYTHKDEYILSNTLGLVFERMEHN